MAWGNEHGTAASLEGWERGLGTVVLPGDWERGLGIVALQAGIINLFADFIINFSIEGGMGR